MCKTALQKAYSAYTCDFVQWMCVSVYARIYVVVTTAGKRNKVLYFCIFLHKPEWISILFRKCSFKYYIYSLGGPASRKWIFMTFKVDCLAKIAHHQIIVYTALYEYFSLYFILFFCTINRNPKAPWKGSFINLHALEWDRYDLDWPEFNKRTQSYMNIGELIILYTYM